jgi:two-component system sensor kinase FixL
MSSTRQSRTQVKPDSLTRFLPPTRRAALLAASITIVAIACADFLIVPSISLGLLYVFPFLIAAGHLSRIEIALFALLCTFLREQLAALPWSEGVAPRSITAFLAYLGIGLLMREMEQHRRTALLQADQLANEVKQREAVEQQLRGLIEGTPAAILTLDPGGKVLLANAAAHELLGSKQQSLPGQLIDPYLPDIARLRQLTRVRHFVRTMVEGAGYRENGEAFLAHIWVSSYAAQSSTGLIAVIFDASEELRTQEELRFRSLTASASIIMGGFWHETRNLCSAMRVLVCALMQRPDVADTEEVEGLKSLVDSLETLAYAELHPRSERIFDSASLRATLDQLRIVIEGSFREQQIVLDWRLPKDLPIVRADRHALMQVFLNLTRNAARALEGSERKELTVAVNVENGRVRVRFHNSSPPIANPEMLFKPLRAAAPERGLGLYVAREIVRSFGGDLLHEPVKSGCCFAVLLEPSELSYIFRE